MAVSRTGDYPGFSRHFCGSIGNNWGEASFLSKRSKENDAPKNILYFPC